MGVEMAGSEEHAVVLEAIAMTGRLLGVLLLHSPEQPDFSATAPLFANPAWCASWPYGTAEELAYVARQFTQQAEESLTAAYQRLFIGPEALAAPPWGSVYLDREEVLFGDSTLALRHWLAEHQIQMLHNPREPEDHIGLLLLMTAWLAEQRPCLLNDFLTRHLFPWSERYLTRLAAAAEHPFYQAVARLAMITLAGWQHEVPQMPAAGTDNVAP